MTSHADNVQQGGGGACESPRVGVFVILWRADDYCRPTYELCINWRRWDAANEWIRTYLIAWFQKLRC